MLLNGYFKLNNQPMSKLEIGAFRLDAFSGDGVHRNKRVSMCLKDIGPIPVGQYYIVDRESGGRLGWLRDIAKGGWKWFALYANDGMIDDWTFCNNVHRGEFRLHPKIGQGISKGCIVVDKEAEFMSLRSFLLSQNHIIPGTDIKTYGMIQVI